MTFFTVLLAVIVGNIVSEIIFICYYSEEDNEDR